MGTCVTAVRWRQKLPDRSPIFCNRQGRLLEGWGSKHGSYGKHTKEDMMKEEESVGDIQ